MFGGRVQRKLEGSSNGHLRGVDDGEGEQDRDGNHASPTRRPEILA